MVDFPPISKEENPVVFAEFMAKHFKETGEIININSILDTIGGAPLRVASKKRKSKKITLEAVEVEVYEPKPKK
jgi:hypothetical protein